MLLVESVQTLNRLDEGFRRKYKHRCPRMKKAIAKVAAARELAVRLFWMLKSNTVLADKFRRLRPRCRSLSHRLGAF